eukprot:gene12580-16870_t
MKTLELGVESTSYKTACGGYSYFRVYMSNACSDLNIQAKTSKGSVGIFVNKATSSNNTFSYPVKTSLTWSDEGSMNDLVTISHWDPESSPGYYYIGIYGVCNEAYSSYTLLAYISNTSSFDSTGSYPYLAYNKLVSASSYEYFEFCLPVCADVTITLQNCLDSSICPTTYSYPELLVTRLTKTPTIYSYSYKLASNTRRYVFINHTDPSARDPHGYLPGSYYVGVYGWCTPDEFVTNNATDGPCSYAANSLFNITVEISALSDGFCDAANEVYQPVNTDAIQLVSGEEVIGNVTCGEWEYYVINVTDPCTDMHVFVGDSSTPDTSVPEYAISKYPNYYPTFDNLAWSSYDWIQQNNTISAWDPNFDGGWVCGPNKNSLCQYYVGIYGYCAGTETSLTYKLQIDMIPAHAIFDKLQLNQSFSSVSTTNPNMRSYDFCVRGNFSVSAVLESWKDSCNCPNNYADLSMVISRTNKHATESDLVWRLVNDDSTEDISTVYLLENDPYTRPGSYYLNVIGSCDATCSDVCDCDPAPCSNLNYTRFAVSVANLSYASSTAKKTEKMLPSCNNNEYLPSALADRVSCKDSDVCEADEDYILSPGAIAGIVIGGVAIVCFI